jgi:hypothetical protein
VINAVMHVIHADRELAREQPLLELRRQEAVS